MIIYTDILILVNFLVDYFLLLLTFKLTENKVKVIRVILSALIGGFSSLYIFIPFESITLDLLYKIVLTFVLTYSSIGFPNSRQFIKFSFVLFSVTSLYGGLIYALYNILKPKGMLFANGVTYFDISPLFLCVATAVFYLTITFLSRIFKKSADTADTCEIIITSSSQNIELKAIVDTGNSVTDFFGKSEIIIADSSSFHSLFDNYSKEELKSRFRVIPCSTVTGEDILKGYRCDSAVIRHKDKIINIDKPILAESKTKLNDGYNAIINPKILL